MMPGTPRPIGQRKLPSSLHEFSVDPPPSLQEYVPWKRANLQVQNNLDKIAVTKEKAEDLIRRSGSRTVLQDCLKRLDISIRSIRASAHNASGMVSEKNQMNIDEMVDNVENVVERDGLH